ncbi:MAG: matrixin family metalloprotease [Phycisphaeraceae bacterium]|nr:MAG: matrixin family metalloprotease [Phycisphaeraceae bacterium]
MRVNIATLLALSGLTIAASAVSPASAARPWLPVELAVENRTAVDHLERALFDALPPVQRLEIAKGMADRGLADEAYERVADLVSREQFDGMRPEWKRAIEFVQQNGNPGLQACFAPGTDDAVVQAFDQLFGAGLRFQPANRWSSTAYSGGGLAQGDPTIVSYSFVPDGTNIADGGLGSGSSQLFAWMNGLYGSTATWQNLFHQVFARWAELSGLTYVYEPNDDGVTHSSDSNVGVQGVRGDVRIGAMGIDGNSGILAYDYYPNNGDMVLDAYDSFFNSTSSNSLRLRNVVAHEHGHGMGMAHVCPANETKLMEPYVSVAYDGPQHDDIQLAQRFYGDPLENNNSAGQATALGATTFQLFTNLSIDDNSDHDYFSITINQQSELVVDVAPTGLTYPQGPQTSQCNSGTSYDSLRIHDLSVDIIGTNGTTVVASADAHGVGMAETVSYVVETPGTYYVRINGDNTDNVQIYSMQVNVNDLPFIPVNIGFVGTPPTEVDPGTATPVSVTITPNDEVVTPGSEHLRFRDDGGSFQTIPLTAQGGGVYAASLPASLCGASPEFYFEAEGDQSGVVTLPSQGAAAPYSAFVGHAAVVLDDNFETDMGWTVSGDITSATAGRWERGVPAGGGDARISDPADDADGSGQCYLTGNVGNGNSDVDGGSTILTSPSFDVSGQPEATITYARWYDNNEGGTASNAYTETFVIEISNNGGSSWTNLETVGPTGAEVSGGWFYKTFRIADFVTPTANVRVRFIASDDVGTVVEAGVDAVNVSGVSCENPGNCNAADIAEPYGVLDLADINAFITGFTTQDPIADLDDNGIFDLGDINVFVTTFTAGCP